MIRAISSQYSSGPGGPPRAAEATKPVFVRGGGQSPAVPAHATNGNAVDGGLRTRVRSLRDTVVARQEVSLKKHQEQVELSATSGSLTRFLRDLHSMGGEFPVEFTWNGKPATVDLEGYASVHLESDGTHLNVKLGAIKRRLGLDSHEQIIAMLNAAKTVVIRKVMP